jgi:hypothetical protein
MYLTLTMACRAVSVVCQTHLATWHVSRGQPSEQSREHPASTRATASSQIPAAIRLASSRIGGCSARHTTPSRTCGAAAVICNSRRWYSVAGLDSINHFRGGDLIAVYKERYGDKTLLAFSRGKDSIAVAPALREQDRGHPVPLFAPDLRGLPIISGRSSRIASDDRCACAARPLVETSRWPREAGCYRLDEECFLSQNVPGYTELRRASAGGFAGNLEGRDP